MLSEAAPSPARRQGFNMPWLVGSLLLMGASWAFLWTVESYWNPLFFFGMWTGATALLRGLVSEDAFPWRRQTLLMALSVPIWWWFELVNGSIQNWHYSGAGRYSALEYALFASLAFSTVVPALDAASKLTLRLIPARPLLGGPAGRWCGMEIALGLLAQALVFSLPRLSFPLVWVAPFLILDGIVGFLGGTNLAWQLRQGRWQMALALALAGLLCGFFWEFWNFWSTPKWTYAIPYLQRFPLFEMPILGYGGYIPFAWSIYQVVELGRQVRKRFLLGGWAG